MEATKQESSIFEGFVKNTIVFYLLLVLVGYLSTLTYYKLFGIDISDYLGIEDYTNMFLDNLFSLLILSILYLVLFAFILKRTGIYIKRKVNNISDAKEKTNFLFKYEKKGTVQLKWTLIISTIIEIVILSVHYFTNSMPLLYVAEIFLFLPIISAFGLTIIYLQKTKLIIINKNQFTVILIILSLSYYKYLITFSDGYNLLTKDRNKQKMTFIFDTKNSIKTTNDTLFLGNSKDYLFLYSRSGKKALLYNKAHIELIINEKHLRAQK